MLILLDPAHGHNTPGKRSPDGTLLEYAYTRDLANQILATLQTKVSLRRNAYCSRD